MTIESTVTLLRWAVPVCFAFHVIEELFWPGGFREWYHRYRPNVAGEPMSYYYKANACYFAATLLVPLGRNGVASHYSLLFVAGILFWNLIFTHIGGTFKTRQYSPGIVTGSLLYIPLLGVSYGYLLIHHVVGIPAAMACLFLSPVCELYFGLKKVKRVE